MEGEKTANENVKVFAFKTPQPDEENGYRQFPAELEDNPNVFFHGTAEQNLASILANGFS